MNPCVEAAYTAGKITKKLRDSLNLADNLEEAIEIETLALTRQKREAAIQALRVADGWQKAKSHEKGVFDGIWSLLARDMTEKAGYNNVDMLQLAYQARYHARFREALAAFRTKNFGLTQDKARIKKLVKAIYGEVVDDPEIMKFAKQWSDLAEEMRVDFNAKGGSISKNEKWLLPQSHDAKKILNKKLPDKGLGDWKAKIKPKLDRSQMLDDLGRPLSDADLEDALDYIFETITTGGLNKAKDLSIPRLGKKLSRRGSDKRFLFFKDADSWADYNDEFGSGNVFTTITDHIETKSNDNAMIEIMGPNPQATFDTLKAMAKKEGGLTEIQESKLDSLWNTVSGKVNAGTLTLASDVGQGTRNVLTASTLGAAMLSATSDVGFQLIAAKSNNISFVKTMRTMIKQLNPANESDRMFAAQIGLGLDEWTDMASTANRFADMYGTGGTAKVADFVMRASFLAHWTDAGRKAFGMEFSASLANNFKKSFGSLDANTKRQFKIYGIEKADWDKFRKSKTLSRGKAEFADLIHEDGAKFHQMVMSETNFAVPTPDANTQAVTTGGYERSSLAGQGVRTVMNLKSFPITILQTHFKRMLNQEGMGKLQYAGLMLGVTTIMGGMALQLKDVAAGRTPRDTGYEDGDIDQMRKFSIASMTQGGGLGIVGDYMFSDVNRFGGGPVAGITGPTGELVSKTAALTLGNLQQLGSGEDTNFAGEAIQYAKRYTPDVWQTRLLTDAMYDQLTMMADPRFNKKFRRQMKKRKKEYDQDYWWKKGEILPEFAQ